MDKWDVLRRVCTIPMKARDFGREYSVFIFVKFNTWILSFDDDVELDQYHIN